MFVDEVQDKIARNYELLTEKGAEALADNKSLSAAGDRFGVNTEVEYRIQNYNRRDEISNSDFKRVRAEFEEYLSGKPNWLIAKEPVEDNVIEQTQNYLQIHQGSDSWLEYKEKLADPDEERKIGGIDSIEYPIRIGMAVEITKPLNMKPGDVTSTTTRRERTRWTYKMTGSSGDLLKVDFTAYQRFSGQVARGPVFYTIEVEALMTYDKYMQQLMFDVSSVLIMMLSQSRVLYQRSVLREFTNQVNEMFIGEEGLSRGAKVPQNQIVKNELNKPIDMKHRDLESGNPDGMFPSLTNIKEEDADDIKGEAPFSVTVKLDGTRFLMLFNGYGTWLFSPISQKVCLLSDDLPPEDLRGVMLDGELLVSGSMSNAALYRFFVFDCLYSSSGDVRELSHRLRLRHCRYIQTVFMESSLISSDFKNLFEMNVKVFYSFKTREEFFAANRKALSDGIQFTRGRELFEEDLDNDGLIFTYGGIYLEKSYFRGQVRSKNRRWKPFHKLTIDFLIEYERDQYVPKVFDPRQQGDQYVTFRGYARLPFDPQDVSLVNNKMSPPVKVEVGQIAEFRWDKVEKLFKPIRIRDDKTNPNEVRVANDNWTLINDPIPPGMLINALMGQRVLQFQRRYTNRVKADLINQLTKKLRVGDQRVRCFDIGSGTGGDVGKFMIADMEVIAVEPSMQRVKMLEKRIVSEGMADQYDILEASAENFKGILKHFDNLNIPKVDCVTMFHSLTFFYETERNVQNLLKTITGVLRPGGIFVCMAMDGKLINQQLGQFNQIELPGIVISRIKHESGRKIRVKLATKDDSLKLGQEEFLVDFDHFIMSLEAVGFELIGDTHLGGNVVLNDSELWWSQMTRVIQLRYVGLSTQPIYDFRNLKALTEEATFGDLTKRGVSQQIPSDKLEFGVYQLEAIGVIKGASSFIHSLMFAMNADYRNALDDRKIQMVRELRDDLGKNFNETFWRNIPGPKSGGFSLRSLRAALKLYTHWFGFDLVKYIAVQLGVNIHVMWWTNQLELYRSFTSNSDRHILLYWSGSCHFKLIAKVDGDELELVLDSSDKLIRVLAFNDVVQDSDSSEDDEEESYDDDFLMETVVWSFGYDDDAKWYLPRGGRKRDSQGRRTYGRSANSGLPLHDVEIVFVWHHYNITSRLTIRLEGKEYFSHGHVMKAIEDFLRERFTRQEIDQMLSSQYPSVVQRGQEYLNSNTFPRRIDLVQGYVFEGLRKQDNNTYEILYGT